MSAAWYFCFPLPLAARVGIHGATSFPTKATAKLCASGPARGRFFPAAVKNHVLLGQTSPKMWYSTK
ncbi:MAG: hypothetical protein DBY34_06050 [Oscillospiraceae bacterium]|nr:MAG: hypothetical protein DBY34_06050 [Oscillospiraceae bacterium]